MKRILIGFGSGFVATLVFHQIALALLSAIGLAPFGPWNMSPTAPFGIPAVLSLSFWGGLWGILFVLIHHQFGSGARYYLLAFLFGAIVPTLVALLIVVPLKGGPIGAGWNPAVWATAGIINGVWGVATGLLVRLLSGSRMTRDSATA